MKSFRTDSVFLILLFITAVTISCGTADTQITENTDTEIAEKQVPRNQKTIDHNGERTYLLHLPKEFSPDNTYPLVIVLHGYGATARGLVSWTGFSRKADKEGFIVAYPNALPYSWNPDNPQCWNPGDPWAEWTGYTDDTGFIKKLILHLCETYPVDRDRVFVTGHSNGAFMAYTVAYELSDLIAAAAPVAGTTAFSGTEAPSFPVSIIHIHSKDDDAVLYEGKSMGGISFPGAEGSVARWAGFYGAVAPETETAEENLTVTSWDYSKDGFELRLVAPAHGKHQWQTMRNSEIDATDMIWEFFKAHPKKR